MADKDKVVLQLEMGGQTIDINRVVGINADIPTLFAVEEARGGGYRLTYNATKIDIKSVEAITLKRFT